jgi:O-antigen/teichoic acid export membrane protein
MKAIGLILFPIYTSVLSIAEYGILGLLEVTAQLLIAVLSLSIHSGVVRFYFDKQYSGKQKDMYFVSLLVVFIVSMVAGIFIFSYSGRFSRILLDNGDYFLLIRLMYVSVIFQVLNSVPTNLMRLQEKATMYTVLMVTRLLISLVVIIYLVVRRNMGLEGILIGQICGHISYFLLVLRFSIRNSQISFDFKLIANLITFSFPLVFALVSSVIITITDRYCLKSLASMDEVGVYSAAYKIANTLLLIFGAMQMALTPMFYQKMEDPNRLRFYSKIITYSIYIGMILTLGISFFGLEIIKVLSRNPDYWLANNAIPVLSFALLFGMVRYYIAHFLSIAKKTKQIALITILVAIINLGLNLLLIPRYSFMGAAFATLVAQLTFLLIMYYYGQKYYYIPYETRKNLLVLGIGAIMIFTVPLLNPLGLGWRLLLKSTIILVFPLVLIPLKYYEAIEKQRLRELFNHVKNMW